MEHALKVLKNGVAKRMFYVGFLLVLSKVATITMTSKGVVTNPRIVLDVAVKYICKYASASD